MASAARRKDEAQGDADVALLERERELAAIATLIEAALDARGAALAIRGEAGLGKTSLLDSAAARAGGRGMRVLRARGEQLEEGFAWGGAVQLFEPVVRDSAYEPAFTGAAALARRLLERAAPAAARDGGREIFPLLHGLHWLTANLSEREPLLLVVDDVHWLDPETLRFLSYLLGRLEALRVGVVVAERPGEPMAAARRALLDRLRAAPATETVTLSPLGEPSVAKLVRGAVPGAGDELCAAFARASAGNPFFAIELAAAARADGLSAVSSDGLARIGELRPDTIRNSIALRLGGLGADARSVATAIAILGPLASQHLVTDLAGLEAEHAVTGVERLIDAGLVRAGETALEFAHPIVREVVYEEISAARRSARHLAAARLLREAGVAPEEIASQLLRATPAREPWALAALREAAARAAGRGAPATATRLLRRALDEVSDPRERRRVLFELGRAEAAAGENGAVAHLREALELPGEEPASPRIAAALAETLYDLGDYGASVQAFERALDLHAGARDADPLLEALLLGGLGSASQLAQGLSPRVAERLERLITAAHDPSSHADRVLLALATGTECLRGELPAPRVIELANHALAGDGVPDVLARTVLEPVVAALTACEDDGILGVLDAVIARARERGELAAHLGLLTLRAHARMRFGHLLEALADAEDAIRIAENELSDQPYTGLARMVLASGQLDRGDMDAAATACDVPGDGERWGAFLFRGYFLVGAARVALAQGRSRAALATVLEAEPVFRRIGPNPALCPWRAILALAAKRCGDTDAAVAIAEEDVRLSRRFGAPGAIGIALRAQAQVEDSPKRRIEPLQEAVDLLAGSTLALEHARALVDLGGAMRRAGWDRAAREPLRRGLELAREQGALGIARWAEEELEAAGARPRPARSGGLAALTPSERRVATMVARGMSNREVAEALFVTRRTVETHLTHAYAKLDISSREELPAALRESPDAAEPPGSTPRGRTRSTPPARSSRRTYA